MSYSLRTMLIAAAVMAVVLTCLIYPDPIVGELFFTAGFLLLAFGTIAAIYSRGKRRAFLIGFLILFGSYCWYSLWSTTARFAPAMMQSGMGMGYASQGLITTRLLSYTYEGLAPDFSTGVRSGVGRPPRAMSSEKAFGRYMGFLVIGHTLIGLSLGVLGGVAARHLAWPAPPTATRSIDEIMREMDVK